MNAPAPQQAAPQPGAAPRRRRFSKEKAQEALKTLKVDKIPVPAIRPSVAVHAGIAAIYVVLAILATAAIWSFGASVAGESGLGRGLGLLVGILVLLAGGLMHDNYVRRRKQETMVHEITNLKDAYGEVMGELEGIKQAIIRPGGQPIFGVETPRGPDAGEVGQEIQALQTLLEKIAKDRSAEGWEAAHARAQSAGQDLTPEQRAARRALLGGLDENKVLAAVDDALKHDRLDLYLKPVVRLPSRKRMGFECSCRIRLPNGASLTADQYGLVAADAGLLGYVQNLLLVRTVQLVRQSLRSNADYVFFCPIAPQTLAERSFLVEFV
ncbi:MAG: EAL domain-containing protein, partial [Alphaproteobacteria bacterium]|nr:EAL domain-containing protein [Alphaproteobacteria bacterium]